MSCERQPDYYELYLNNSLLSISSFISSMPQFQRLEIPDSQDQEVSQDTTSPSLQLSKECSPETTRDDRIRIQTALLFNIPWERICKVLKVTPRQIQYGYAHRLTPQKQKAGRKPLIRTPQRRQLEEWLLSSPSHRRIPWKRIPKLEQEFQDYGEQAISTAFTLQGYCRRVSKRKGFSSDPEVCAERLDFAKDGITWTREMVLNICFSDDVTDRLRILPGPLPDPDVAHDLPLGLPIKLSFLSATCPFSFFTCVF